ncbi:MAG TPA: hypothetical protein VIV11_19320 [Kofleriaceae bacterium]
MRRGCELALIACCAACTQDFVDLTGVYRVDENVLSMPCGMDAPVAAPWPYLEIAESTQLAGFWLRRCSDRATTNCVGDIVLDALSQPTGEGWLGEITGTSGTSPCTLVYVVQSARLDGEHLIFVVEEHREEVPDFECSIYEAQLRSTLMPCTKHERFDATRL